MIEVLVFVIDVVVVAVMFFAFVYGLIAGWL